MIDKLFISKSYAIKNVQYRNFQGIPSLTVTSRTQITEIEDIGPIKTCTITIPRLKGTVKQIMMNTSWKCSVCTKPISEVGENSQDAKCAA